MGDSTETLLRGKMALESLGHTLVPFDMPDCFELYMTIMGADNLRHLKNAWWIWSEFISLEAIFVDFDLGCISWKGRMRRWPSVLNVTGWLKLILNGYKG